MKIIFYILLISVFSLSSCSSAETISDPVPKHDHFRIYSKHVKEERVINVWIPQIPNTVPQALPVMYMADGGIKEDFPHIANTLEKLIKENKMKPMILVGIENTQRRRDLTGFTEVESDKAVAPIVGGSANFRAFIKEELIPEIQSRYNTTSERSVIGESLSGLFVMETFFLDPELFDNYIAFDPSLWWNNHHLVRSAKENLSKFPTSNKKLWFASSSAEDISQYTKQLAKILEAERSMNLEWNYSDEPKEQHATIFRATKEKAIVWTLNPSE